MTQETEALLTTIVVEDESTGLDTIQIKLAGIGGEVVVQGTMLDTFPPTASIISVAMSGGSDQMLSLAKSYFISWAELEGALVNES